MYSRSRTDLLVSICIYNRTIPLLNRIYTHRFLYKLTLKCNVLVYNPDIVSLHFLLCGSLYKLRIHPSVSSVEINPASNLLNFSRVMIRIYGNNYGDKMSLLFSFVLKYKSMKQSKKYWRLVKWKFWSRSRPATFFHIFINRGIKLIINKQFWTDCI